MGLKRFRGHKRIPVIYYISVVTFMLSLILIAYSAVQIVGGRMEVKSSLEKWDNLVLVKASAEFNKDSLKSDETAVNTGSSDGEQAKDDKVKKAEENPMEGAMGVLNVGDMDIRAAIFEGTETEQLKKGIGHYKGTALLGQSGNCVLTGHNDTVFRNLGRLKNGDAVSVETTEGIYKYKVIGIKIVDESDMSVLAQGKDKMLTLITCYPFSYIGLSSERYTVIAQLDMPVK